MRKLFILAIAALLLTACHHHDDKPEKFKRTVLVYMAGDNNLYDYIRSDIMQMRIGSRTIPQNDKLLLFIDKSGDKPMIVEVSQGDTLRLKTFETELKSSDAATLKMAMQWAMSNYEAEDYGLVLWGHADGWIIKEENATARGPRRAYGADVTGGTTWMEIADMAKALNSLPRLKFIFADCCAFQCVESAYELRQCTDYIIGSAAEIPGEGAPYQTVVPAMFSTDENFYQLIVDAYFEQTSGGFKEPLSVIKTSELDNLAQATHNALGSFLPDMEDGGRYPDVSGLIYYYNFTQFDMNDFIMRYASDNIYAEWKKAFDQTVIYKTMAPVWMANHIIKKTNTTFRDFEVTEERYGGVGMFVPRDVSKMDQREYSNVYLKAGFDIADLNEQIKKTQWYAAAGLASLGW